MNRQLALVCGIVFILYLYISDHKSRPMSSWGLWIALIWIIIIGSRPVSYWFGMGIDIETPDDYIEGSPIDRMVFLAIEIAGLIFLAFRKIKWVKIVRSNLWIFVFFIYWGMSTIWSEYSLVSLKRWIKDIGNLVMILIILSEENPSAAIRAVFARFSYIVIPLSVIFIKYFPELGRYYNRWTWTQAYSGVTTGKNALACITLVCALFLIWDLVEIHKKDGIKLNKIDFWARVIILLMVFWIFSIVDSSTALICFIIGAIVLFYLNLPGAKTQFWYLGTYGMMTIMLILSIFVVPNIIVNVVELFGRNLTFTGRTEIWSLALSMPINPIFGTGYQSFWLGSFAERFWDTFYFHPNQAHNGYLETYLNGGMIGLALLLATIGSTGIKLKDEFILGKNYSSLLLAFYVVAIIYNITEAVFNRMDIIWIIFLAAALSRYDTLRHGNW